MDGSDQEFSESKKLASGQSKNSLNVPNVPITSEKILPDHLIFRKMCQTIPSSMSLRAVISPFYRELITSKQDKQPRRKTRQKPQPTVNQLKTIKVDK